MTTDTALTVAALRRLAEAEEPCPGDNTNHEGCFVCNGTGRVPLFRDADGKALLRKKCKNLVLDAHDVQYGFGNRHHPDKCYICHGPGWLPLDVNEVHLEMLLFVAINNEHESLAGGQLFHAMMGALEARAQSAKREQDLIEAALLVLDAAVEARG